MHLLMGTPWPSRTLSLEELECKFLHWLEREARLGRCSPRTIRYYRQQLQPLVADLGKVDVSMLQARDLRDRATSWHRVQAAQRLFAWAEDPELGGAELGAPVERNPWRHVPRPPLGQRVRVLRPWESARMLRAARPHLRRFLIAMRESLARPQELRSLRWFHWDEQLGAFVLTDFKGRKARKDGLAVRVLPVSPRLARLLSRLRRRRPKPAGAVFVGQAGRAWSSNALRCAMARLRRRCGIAPVGGENVVAYTWRHTAATNATRNGVRDRLLADLMGHASTSTTARYQHLAPEHLAEAIRLATARRR
jgi:integrase